MAHSTLAPEDDSSDRHHDRNLELTAGDHRQHLNQVTELQRLRFRFNPHKVGFGILPWPSTEGSKQIEDKVLIAMNYLAEGKLRRDREGNK
jgi:hypothetical protein